ncbi:hypothetical protein FGG08_006280 [Glutinoglossum americanum]|uniref:Phosphatidylinositol-specific phospholipase C X domain-containing protein n=1 Tax=Glutinoglossum americanum TaxID=1670608 RepID=A0A9P8I180_9PEZI|nr:hypothetical protein FGG08_006280 [Glutinoglossum americanum]
MSVTNLSILGSHNSLAYSRPGRPPVSNISRTQVLDLRRQLGIGVRYLDVRMRHYKNAFVAHHGATYLWGNFEDVVRDLCWFLSGGDGEEGGGGGGKGETIIMRLKRETGSWDVRAKNERDWEGTLFEYFFTDTFGTRACLERIWWRPPLEYGNEWPTLGEARGKIIILENFRLGGGRSSSIRYGFRWYDWNSILLQDEYRVPALSGRKKKFEAVVGFWRKYVDFGGEGGIEGTGAVREEGRGKLLVNHVSGSGSLAWPIDVATGAKGLNRRVGEWLVGEGKGARYLGVVVEDFVSVGDVEGVVGRNFRGGLRGGKGELESV